MATSDSSTIDGYLDVPSTYRAAGGFLRTACGRTVAMRQDRGVSAPFPGLLAAAAAEIEAHVGAAGWDRPPALFALVRAAQFAADEPETAARLGLDPADGQALTPIEQESLPDAPLDEALARLAWPDAVAGCALSQEIVVLPPSAETDLPSGAGAARAATAHPDRREARLVVAVLRTGDTAAVLRLRGNEADPDPELLTGPDLAPNLAAALLATFTED